MNIYDFEAKNTKGEVIPLKKFEGQVLLVVNTATGCGFTPQYEDLEKLYKEYQVQGLEILDFPCNQFGHQAPGSDEEIVQFCTMKFGVSFQQFSKIDVNGEGAHPLFQYLQEQKSFKGFDQDNKLTPVLESMLSAENPGYAESPAIKWNFTKFLIDRKGTVVERFEPTADFSKIEASVKSLLQSEN